MENVDMYPILRDTQNTSMPQSISTDWRTRKRRSGVSMFKRLENVSKLCGKAVDTAVAGRWRVTELSVSGMADDG